MNIRTETPSVRNAVTEREVNKYRGNGSSTSCWFFESWNQIATCKYTGGKRLTVLKLQLHQKLKKQNDAESQSLNPDMCWIKKWDKRQTSMEAHLRLGNKQPESPWFTASKWKQPLSQMSTIIYKQWVANKLGGSWGWINYHSLLVQTLKWWLENDKHGDVFPRPDAAHDFSKKNCGISKSPAFKKGGHINDAQRRKGKINIFKKYQKVSNLLSISIFVISNVWPPPDYLFLHNFIL